MWEIEDGSGSFVGNENDGSGGAGGGKGVALLQKPSVTRLYKNEGPDPDYYEPELVKKARAVWILENDELVDRDEHILNFLPSIEYRVVSDRDARPIDLKNAGLQREDKDIVLDALIGPGGKSDNFQWAYEHLREDPEVGISQWAYEHLREGPEVGVGPDNFPWTCTSICCVDPEVGRGFSSGRTSICARTRR